MRFGGVTKRESEDTRRWFYRPRGGVSYQAKGMKQPATIVPSLQFTPIFLRPRTDSNNTPYPALLGGKSEYVDKLRRQEHGTWE